MNLVLGTAGLGLITWALGAGVFTSASERPRIFSGTGGRVLNALVIFVAVNFIWIGWFGRH